MARFHLLPMIASHFIIFTTLLLSSLTIIQATFEENHDFETRLNPQPHGLKKEKFTHFRVYWHDIYSGTKPTALAIVHPPSNSSNSSSIVFGSVSMIDDPLTIGPELNSKLIGRAQGFYGSASQQDVALLVAMNFVFLEGKYNGSTITILGRDQIFSKVREMPVIGGSGLFRFARGYVHANTYSFNQKTGDAVVEYNVYVLHY